MWSKKQKKTIFTLNVDGYSPEITDLTYPLIEAYARKIGADFHIIGERKFPEWPVTYEKLQIYQLAQEMENDWNIYIDSDALVHPDTPDLTLLLDRDTVAHFGKDFSPVRWKTDRFFERDGRHIGSGNWLTVASDLCIDLWKPVDDLTPAEAIANISPSVIERRSGVVHPSHLIDDYILSRNIAKYGFKFKVFRDIFMEAGYKEGGSFFYHHYLYPTAQKLIEMKKVLRTWGVVEIMGLQIEEETPIDKAERIPGRMARAELDWLYRTAKTMESVVEIGSLKGRSTFALCSGCNGGKGKVYAIDPFIFYGDWMNDADLQFSGYKPGDSFFPDFLKNCGHFPHLAAIKKRSVEAAAELPNLMADMVFIDGNHDRVNFLADLNAWAPRAKKLVCGHDLDEVGCEGVRQGLEEYFGMDRVVRGPKTLWIVPVEQG
jgi:hypothetical protein